MCFSTHLYIAIQWPPSCLLIIISFSWWKQLRSSLSAILKFPFLIIMIWRRCYSHIMCRWKPGTPLNILRFTGQPLTAKNSVAHMSILWRLGKPTYSRLTSLWGPSTLTQAAAGHSPGGSRLHTAPPTHHGPNYSSTGSGLSMICRQRELGPGPYNRQRWADIFPAWNRETYEKPSPVFGGLDGTPLWDANSMPLRRLYVLEQWFSTGVTVFPGGHVTMSKDIWHNWRVLPASHG